MPRKRISEHEVNMIAKSAEREAMKHVQHIGSNPIRKGGLPTIEIIMTRSMVEHEFSIAGYLAA